MSAMKNPYAILGISPDASVEEVKSAYRKIARRLHPDVNPNSPAAAEQFQDVALAHELLTDPARKKAYDEQHSEGDDGYYFTLQITPSKRSLMPLPEPQVIYLLTEIFPDPRATQVGAQRESRLNLTLVLDRSNSMSGARIEGLKHAGHQIVDNLDDNDIISVVTFNDRAETVIPATTVTDRPSLKARISMMAASGGTEIYHGLKAGVDENRKFLGPRLINHVILLTDGHTYGDQESCLELAGEASTEGIGISAMGLGYDWNDEFLDEIASRTGGNTVYINSANEVVRFLNNQVRSLSNAFAERMKLSVAPDPDIVLETAFKLSPHPQPLPVDGGVIPLGSLQLNRPISALLQFQIPSKISEGFRSIGRIVATGDILVNQNQSYQMVSDFASEVTSNPSREDPPTAILDALSKLTLYRLQERARESLESGNVHEATRRLENLATRLLELGQGDLANQALSEARRVAHTSALSEQGSKNLKYQTRYLLLGDSTEDEPV